MMKAISAICSAILHAGHILTNIRGRLVSFLVFLSAKNTFVKVLCKDRQQVKGVFSAKNLPFSLYLRAWL
jgi:hypothetical protein